MSVSNVTVPDFSQYNFEIGDTVDVVTKQNGVNQALENFGASLNTSINQFNQDINLVNQRADELNVNQIVHAQGSGLPNEAGTAASRDVTTSSTDTGAGRLMKVGDFGIGGGAVTLSDVNSTSIRSGFYRFTNTTTGTFPKGTGFGFVFIERYDVNNLRQTLEYVGNSGPRANKAYQRSYNANASGWNAWRLVYDQQNILGTVSQSGGVPMGAIIEFISNSNGKAVRYADGTQMVWNDDSLVSTDPATFVGTPAIIDSGKFKIGRWY